VLNESTLAHGKVVSVQNVARLSASLIAVESSSEEAGPISEPTICPSG
jgi:hypothetical protein